MWGGGGGKKKGGGTDLDLKQKENSEKIVPKEKVNCSLGYLSLNFVEHVGR